MWRNRNFGDDLDFILVYIRLLLYLFPFTTMGLFDAKDRFLEHALDRRDQASADLVKVTGETMLENGKNQGRFEVANKVKHMLEMGKTEEALQYVNSVWNAQVRIEV